MAAIPTILKGDDSGAIQITMATGRSYVGATLVVAYQGVTRSFTNLNPGQTINLIFTHEETAGFTLGTKPLLMRLIGQYGAEETVENAEARIKVTDCMGEVNAGGSFIVRPGEAGSDPTKVPITDVGDMAARYTMADLQAKVNQIIRVLAQRSLLALAVCGTFAAFGVTAQTARLDALYNDSVVVTNVTDNGGVSTNEVNAIISQYNTTNLVGRFAEKAQIVYEDWTHRPMITNDVEATKGNFQNLDADKFDVATSMSAEKATIHNLIVDESFDMSELDVSVGSIYAGGNIATVDGDIITTNGTIKIGPHEIVKSIRVNTDSNILRGDVMLEIPKRGTFNAAINGYNAAVADNAVGADKAGKVVDADSLEMLYWNPDDARWKSLQWYGSDYELRDGLAWAGEVDGCLKKTGGTMTGDLVFNDPDGGRHLTIGFDGIIRGEGEGSFYLPNRADGGTIAMIDNIPTSFPWASVTGKPNTLAGYGITDTFTKIETDERYLQLSGGEITGNLTVGTGESYPKVVVGTSEYQQDGIFTQNSWLRFPEYKNDTIALLDDLPTASSLRAVTYAADAPEAHKTAVGILSTAENTAGTIVARGYTHTNAVVALSRSVQYVADPAGVTIQVPTVIPQGVRDWVVYVQNTGAATIPLTLDSSVSWYGADAAYTNALKNGKMTALYFTEITTNKFAIGRAELDAIQAAH